MDSNKIIQVLDDSLKNLHCGFVDGIGDVYAVSEQTIKNIIAILKEQIKNRDESLEKAREEIKWLRRMLKEQEAVEPVKFVRCKNCKHCDGERIDKNMIWCKIHQFGRPDDYYCADGIEK